MQPIEGIRLLLALFLAGYFSQRWEVLRGLRARTIGRWRPPSWLNLPRLQYVLPVLAAVVISLLFFFVQKDLGPALLLCCVFLAVYAVARGRVGMAVVGLLLLIAGFYAGYRIEISRTLAQRLQMWSSPWDNSVPGGNQVSHAIWAMATGGPWGTGLGLGDARYLPEGHTDLVLAAIGEELGAVGLLVVFLLFAAVAWRGFRIARQASSDYGFFLALALTLFVVAPVVIMAAGVMGVTPLTGVVTPFLSYGGSAMLANFAALGLLAAIRHDRRPAADFVQLQPALRYLGGVLAVCAVALAVQAVSIQVVRADELVVRPHLALQGDGGRRYVYNPRIVALVESIPRATILDRRGVPLATENPEAIVRARTALAPLDVTLGDACPEIGRRCYPLGGRAFHLLGDARSRLNWTANNIGYVEKDYETRLIGFDAHESNVETVNRDGERMFTLQRDYSALIPALRRRYERNAPALPKPADLRLTVDAGLQLQVARIVAKYARQSKVGNAAAIVLDADTGAILAGVSYPWPDASTADRTGHDPDALTDRARFGTKPPGSTFKLVVAAAALRQDPMLRAATYSCRRLPDGRIGAMVNGRRVRDDVEDARPHGTISLHDGLVHSCNAYFAQLAVTLGPETMVDAGARVGIELTNRSRATREDQVRAVRQTLPQVGFGQAEVTASPMRLAVLASAIATDGQLREPYLAEEEKREPPAGLLDPASARLLAGYMRDAVLRGTGRVLSRHAWPIAGKTGTAEVAGAPSHGWFVGFAPAGPAKKRIAFAILVENAGYGGATAAPAAGEIVTAAAAAGLIAK